MEPDSISTWAPALMAVQYEGAKPEPEGSNTTLPVVLIPKVPPATRMSCLEFKPLDRSPPTVSWIDPPVISIVLSHFIASLPPVLFWMVMLPSAISITLPPPSMPSPCAVTATLPPFIKNPSLA